MHKSRLEAGDPITEQHARLSKHRGHKVKFPRHAMPLDYRVISYTIEPYNDNSNNGDPAMLFKLFSKLEKVYLATTQEERDAIYRFRYTIYYEELGREIGGVDHERKMVVDDDDEKPTSYHLYIGSKDNIIGTVRVQVWEPGQVPKADYEISSMDMFPGIDKLVCGEMGRFMIKRTSRGKLTLPAMARGVYEFLVTEKKLDLAFLYCRPGLVNHYRRLGARPYGGRMIDLPEGLEIPLVMVASDYKYFKAMKSPLAPFVKDFFGSSSKKRPPLDTSAFSHLFDDDALPVVTDTDKVWEEVQNNLMDSEENLPSFLENLPDKVIRKLSEQGYIMDTPAGMMVTREGHSEREMYVILEGVYDIMIGEKCVRTLGRGDVMGEIAFFHKAGTRTASVVARRDGRIVTLRRKFLDELRQSDPKAAHDLLFNLARILAERLADVR